MNMQQWQTLVCQSRAQLTVMQQELQSRITVGDPTVTASCTARILLTIGNLSTMCNMLDHRPPEGLATRWLSTPGTAICHQCGQPITDERLLVHPGALFCDTCWKQVIKLVDWAFGHCDEDEDPLLQKAAQILSVD